MRTTTTIGPDIAKSVFPLHRIDGQVLRPKTTLTECPALVRCNRRRSWIHKVGLIYQRSTVIMGGRHVQESSLAANVRFKCCGHSAPVCLPDAGPAS